MGEVPLYDIPMFRPTRSSRPASGTMTLCNFHPSDGYRLLLVVPLHVIQFPSLA